MARSIYVPLDPPEYVDVLVAMAKHFRRSPHDQAAFLLTQALDSWAAERAFEASLDGESTPELEVA